MAGLQPVQKRCVGARKYALQARNEDFHARKAGVDSVRKGVTSVIRAVRRALSDARLSTFERAVVTKSVDDPAPLGLYTWNAVISGALLAPLQVCEVVIRNAVSDALESIYGSEWPWNRSFEGSLPHGRKSDLLEARRVAEGTDTVIPKKR